MSMPPTGALIARFGSKRCTLAGTLALCIALAAIGLAQGPVSLGILLACYGAAAGAMDVSMNSQGVTVETYCGRRVMSGFHALFSVGAMAGAFFGGVIASAGISVEVHLCVAALANAALALWAVRYMLDQSYEQAHADVPVFAIPRGPVLGMGALAFCIFLCEGALADWTGVYLRDTLQANPTAAASGFASFSAAMAVGRFLGDRITDRFGPVNVIRYGCLLSALGYACTLLASTLPLALMGLIATGLGLAATVPIVFGAAGRLGTLAPGAGIAAVTTMGFTGFLSGPAVIGWIAEASSLRMALSALVGLSVLGAVLARAVPEE